MVVFLFNTVIYVFSLLCLCILIVRLCIFIVPAGTLRLPWLRLFRAFSSVVRHMPGYNQQRQGTARILPNFLCCSTYCLFCVVLCIVCVCVCIYECVLYYCHRVDTQLHLTNISYNITNISYSAVPQPTAPPAACPCCIRVQEDIHSCYLRLEWYREILLCK